ncbi:hypothetical protein IGI04_008653 [Brassica rapa subsp. trilocularis]|uniref:TF-B3 domain-containing protein n=1 Tax=Brassica rapa subsp. trilocularis TaxID=1813537 RepID=A0ABQ7NRI7_BRACM|nr:hypothetical protein IGI04_008653 [Brassica rapa subsp. trilocularis]
MGASSSHASRTDWLVDSALTLWKDRISRFSPLSKKLGFLIPAAIFGATANFVGFVHQIDDGLCSRRSKAIPLDFYSKHIQGAEINKPWKLRSDASDKIWEVIREGRTLTKGWKEFTEAHDLRIGDIVIFKHEGDMVFHVTPFGPSCCEIQYTHPHIVKEEADADDAPTFSYDYCFLAEVTATNQKDDKMVSKI